MTSSIFTVPEAGIYKLIVAYVIKRGCIVPSPPKMEVNFLHEFPYKNGLGVEFIDYWCEVMQGERRWWHSSVFDQYRSFTVLTSQNRSLIEYLLPSDSW